MSFLKKLLYEEETAETTQQPVANVTKQSTQSVTASSPVGNPSFNASNIIMNAGTVDQKFLDHFTQVMDAANLPGPDYYEFKKALDGTVALQNSVTEDVRFKMVFGTMSASGALTKEQLIATAKQYLTILETELSEYNASVENKRVKEIGSREDQIKTIDTENQEKAELINTLTQEIQENNMKRTQIQNEIMTESSALEQKKKNFETSYQSVYNGITQDITKIEQYLS